MLLHAIPFVTEDNLPGAIPEKEYFKLLSFTITSSEGKVFVKDSHKKKDSGQDLEGKIGILWTLTCSFIIDEVGCRYIDLGFHRP
jgi:hypothetical protein